MDVEKVKPYNEEENKTKQLNRMFNTISGKYDKFNDIMTMRMAHRWRRRAIETLKPYSHANILDIATGTADIAIKAFEYLTPKTVTGIDISEKMLEIGNDKIRAAGLSEKIQLQVEDVSQMSFDDASFDAVLTSFGIRNFEKLQESILEIYRVLKKGGKFVVLEMSEPQTPVIKQGYLLYTKTLIPFAVRTFSNDPKAYKYLTNSMEAFPQGKEFIAILESLGFKKFKYKTFFLGVCSLYAFEKV